MTIYEHALRWAEWNLLLDPESYATWFASEFPTDDVLTGATNHPDEYARFQREDESRRRCS